MTFINRIIPQLKEGVGSIHIKSEISGASWAELKITILDNKPITLDTTTDRIKIRFQHLISGVNGFTPTTYRIDNHFGKPLHQHFLGSEYPLETLTMNELFRMIVGSEWVNKEESLK